jgi:uncharacterized protein (DUF58 family)
VRTPRLLSASLLVAVSSVVLAGCSAPPIPLPSASNDPAEQRHQLDEIRADIAQIPLPSKSRYLAIKSLNAWENPYLTIQGGMVTLHVTVADANTTDLGVGGILRPVGARQQTLNVRMGDLPAALNAIPQTAWPYGRVVAVEEAHDAPASARPQLRRNMEAAVKTLNDVGVVVYEWQENQQGLR